MAITDFFEKMNFLEKKKIPDELGGWVTEFNVGAEFCGVMQRQGVAEQTLAVQKGLAEVYVLIVEQKYDLNPNDYIRKDGIDYRVVTDELKTPSKSNLNLNQYQLENVKKVG